MDISVTYDNRDHFVVTRWKNMKTDFYGEINQNKTRILDNCESVSSDNCDVPSNRGSDYNEASSNDRAQSLKREIPAISDNHEQIDGTDFYGAVNKNKTGMPDHCETVSSENYDAQSSESFSHNEASSNDRSNVLKMENPTKTENSDIPPTFDYPSFSGELIDSDLQEVTISIDDNSGHYEELPNERIGNLEATSYNMSFHNEAFTNDRPENVQATSRDVSDAGRGTTKSSDGVSPGGNQWTRIFDWIRIYKKLLIGIISGCLLIILIVVPAVYISTKSKYETDNPSKSVNERYYPLIFDQSTLHNGAYISTDGLRLVNLYSKDTPVSSMKTKSTFSNYSSVIGNRCFDDETKLFFEIEYILTMLSTIDDDTSMNLIFEVGLAEREKFDGNQYVGTTYVGGWSFHLHFCDDILGTIVCISFQRNSFSGEAYGDFPLHPASVMSKYNGKLGFIINNMDEEFSVVLHSDVGQFVTDTVKHTFHHVSSLKKLCPVFAVVNSKNYEVIMTHPTYYYNVVNKAKRFKSD